MHKIHRLSRLILVLSVLLIPAILLQGCAESIEASKTWRGAFPNDPDDPTSNRPSKMEVTQIEPLKQSALSNAPRVANLPPVKVAILLPLSGKHAALGQSMLQAAQMALFEMGYDNFNLLPRDTKGTAVGAKSAAETSLNDGAQLIIGPLFAESVRAVQQVTASKNINIISFSTDWTLAGPGIGQNTYLMGFMPFAQVERVVGYANDVGFQNFGLIAPMNKYGDTVSRAFAQKITSSGNRISRQMRFIAGANDLSAQIENFAQESAPVDAVFIPVGGPSAETIAGLLSFHGLPANRVKYIGTGLWDDERLIKEQNLRGAIFAGPSPTLRKSFEQRYQNLYSQAPVRLASLAYDATALAAVLAQQGGGANGFNRAALTNPNGFAGTDGIFRFGNNGLVERGLAILELSGGKTIEVSPAPRSFQ
ncbi:MAG: penicillin-binding protein activator [Pseudomonadota bacterium]